MAETASSDSAGSTSKSEDRDSERPTRDSKDAAADRDADDSADPAKVSTRTKSKSAITLQRPKVDVDQESAEDDSTETSTEEASTEEKSTEEKSTKEPEPAKRSSARKHARDIEDVSTAEADTAEPSPNTPATSTPVAAEPVAAESVAPPEPNAAEITAAASTQPVAVTPARSPGPVTTLVLNVMSALGWSPRPPPAAILDPTPRSAANNSAEAAAVAAAPGPVTGVQTGHSTLTIPLGTDGYTTRADWYFPTQADGSVSATGVIWLQHGFLADKSWYSALATSLSQQTNSIVVAPNVPSFSLFCSGC